MAKYGRYDPRNKKKRRNKIRSIDKDLRLRSLEESRSKWKIRDWQEEDEEMEPQTD